MQNSVSAYKPVRRRVLTVSELTAGIKDLLEDAFPFVWLVGEISNLRQPGSGHLYFTLKDSQAQIRAMMFKGQNRLLKFTPEDGISITVLGRVAVYEPQGTYQIICEHVEPAGAGALALAFEQLKDRLSKEGLFDAARKKSLPFLPGLVAVITSASGAVIHDILRVALRRFPGANIQVLPVRVQGQEACGEIVRALALVEQRGRADVVILARGGGSLEDLAPFNSEEVARAIFACSIPVVSAVGHETDYTITDFVADMRAPTPSAAAELVFPEKDALYLRLDDLQERMSIAMQGIVSGCRQRAMALRARLESSGPAVLFENLEVSLELLSRRLAHALSQKTLLAQHAYAMLAARLWAVNPAREARRRLEQALSRLAAWEPGFVDKRALRVDLMQGRLIRAMENILQGAHTRLKSLDAARQALSPRAVLSRGYSITRVLPRPGKVLKDSAQVERGCKVEIMLAHGSLEAKVEKKL